MLTVQLKCVFKYAQVLHLCMQIIILLLAYNNVIMTLSNINISQKEHVYLNALRGISEIILLGFAFKNV